MRAVDALMECLKAEGVDVVFGLPGGANLPTYDAFVTGGIRHILVRHEAGGGHAAEGYAKATGKVGVAFATSGPGATNLLTPITDAMMDSVPVVFITGQVRTELLGTDGFQEADTIGITMPVVKHSVMIQDPQELPRAIHEAFHIARSGRPGPVLVDIPMDLSRAEIDYEPVTDVRLPGYQPKIEGNQKQIRQAAKALAAAQRPVIYAGGGVVNANASAELTEFVTADRFPITCTLMGLGAFPAPHPQWLGMLGMHGTRAANYAMDEADLICAVGARFDDRITGKLSEFAPAREVHPHRRRPGGDLQERARPHPDRRRRQERAREADRRVPRDRRRPRAAGCVVEPDRRLESQVPARLRGHHRRRDQAAVHGPGAVRGHRRRGDRHQRRRPAPDVGRAVLRLPRAAPLDQLRRARHDGLRAAGGDGRRRRLPDRVVCCIAGDGSVQMNAQELATCAQNKIPIKVFIMNNGYLGMVRQWQELFWDGQYSHVDMGEFPDFVKLAEAYGVTGMRFSDKSTLVEDMKRAIATEGPVLVDVRVTREENTYPMIPAGQAAREMVG